MPLAFSKTQDDKGRVRWTFFGGSEQGPDRAFWKSFYSAPGRERRPEHAVDFVRRLLQDAYGETPERLTDLRQAGFRILPGSGESACRLWRQGPLPSWTAPFLFREGERLSGVNYLLTFRPFGSLPKAVRKAYLEGRLHLLPFPGSLIFWGAPRFLKLQSEFPQAMQIPLLNVCERREQLRGLRILQSGWLHEPRPGQPDAEGGRPSSATRTGAPTAGSAWNASRTIWPWSATTSACRTFCSAPTRLSSAFTASRWRGIPRSGPIGTRCCWTGRAPVGTS